MPIQEVIYEKELGQKVPVKIWATNVEEQTKIQAIEVASLPNIHSHVALMPDTHLGKGVPIGCVLPLKRAISPNAVGVDIGCGMCAWKTDVPLEGFDVNAFMKKITENVPAGFRQRSKNDSWLSHELILDEVKDILDRFNEIGEKSPIPWRGDEPLISKALKQIGTLGGGNHFYELQVDKDGIMWIMIHSGSRGIGAITASHFHDKALGLCNKWFTDIPNPDLAFLPEDDIEGQRYIERMKWCQDYALFNRKVMLFVGQMLMRDMVGKTNNRNDFINIHHNFAQLENHFGQNVWVHRKGATPARPNIVGIIPGSMCSKSYIVSGKAEKDSFSSCSHGAGRSFSRTQARKRVEDGTDPSQSSQLGSVKLFGTENAHDELGSAYKDISVVMQNQDDLVDIKIELSPVAVIKGDSKSADD